MVVEVRLTCRKMHGHTSDFDKASAKYEGQWGNYLSEFEFCDSQL